MQHRLKILIVLSLILALIFPVSASARQAPEKWFFGWNNETGDFVAFNISGTVNPLLTIDPDFPPVGWRLADDRALAVLTVQGVTGLYVLMPDGVQQILPDAGAARFLSLATTLALYQEPYAVLEAQEGAFSVGLLVDFSGARVEALPGESFAPMDNWRMSADGTLLRYVTREARDGEEWTLWERTLSSGEDRPLYAFTGSFPIIQADANGGHWIHRALQTEPRMLIHTVIFGDGTSQPLAQEAVSDPIGAYTSYLLFGDNLLVFTAPCSADCVIENRPLAGGSPQTFTIPAIISPQVTPLAQVDTNKILILVENTFWLLDTAANAVELGRYDGSLTAFGTGVEDLVSPDGQWLLSFGNDGQLKLWYLPIAALALETGARQQVSVLYQDAGVLISQFETRQTIFYRYADGLALDLLHGDADFYAGIASDTSLLYINTQANADLLAGGYRYEPDTGVVSLLVENLFPLQLR